jgi:hypothetical protein
MKTTYLTLLVSALAAGGGLLSFRRTQEAEHRLEEMRASYFRLTSELRERIETLESETRALHQQARLASGDGNLFEPDATIAEVVGLHPRAADVLQGFHIGGCSSCAVDSEDTLRYAAQANGQNLDLVLQALNRLTSGEEAEVARLMERQPNVRLSL